MRGDGRTLPSRLRFSDAQPRGRNPIVKHLWITFAALPSVLATLLVI
jgi:hypothetical protein